MSETRKLRVFLCHASQDKPIVRDLYHKLLMEGWIDPWLDEAKLLPGQDWDMKIEEAVELADAVIVCLSNKSITKEGYVQRELRRVLNRAEEKPDETIYIIPLRLEDCSVPWRLRDYQYQDYFPEESINQSYEKLLYSLEVRAEKFSINILEIKKRLIQLREEKERKELAEKIRSEATQKIQIEEEKQLRKYAEELARQKIINEALEKAELEARKIFDRQIIHGVEFCRVPAGEFLMGINIGDRGHFTEMPKHNVNINYDYWIARFPITNKQYAQFTKAKGLVHPLKNWEKKYDHPVHNVSWYDAVEFCDWFNKLVDGQLLTGYIIRLPTEAEWEKAARGKDGRTYPWGNEITSKKCNTGRKASFLGVISNTKITPVGFYSPEGDSPYGCCDMCGNVSEWTNSLYKKYPYDMHDGREDVKREGSRVIRSGAYWQDEEEIESYKGVGAHITQRDGYKPNSKISGFRIVISIPI